MTMIDKKQKSIHEQQEDMIKTKYRHICNQCGVHTILQIYPAMLEEDKQYYGLRLASTGQSLNSELLEAKDMFHFLDIMNKILTEMRRENRIV